MNYATYSVSASQWTSRLISIPLDAPTPLMLANHVYWNLDAFTTGPKKNILNNTLHMPYAARAVVVDPILVPTGQLEAVAGGPLDFTSPKQIGRDIQNAHQCGFNCTSYDNAFILDRPRYSAAEASDLVMLTISSPATGIQMDIRTNQQSMQVYACGGQNGTIGVKASQEHGTNGEKTYVEEFGCVSLYFDPLPSFTAFHPDFYFHFRAISQSPQTPLGLTVENCC